MLINSALAHPQTACQSDSVNRINNRTINSILEAAIEFALSTAPEAIVSVRGKDRFVVMDMAHYHYLRGCELDAALAETRADLAAGRTVQESPEAHLARLDAL